MVKSYFKQIFIINSLVGFLISIMAAYFLFPPYFDNGIYPVQPSEYLWMSLDPSWVSALNYVKIQNLTWGKDFAFTYGPLSFLSTRVGWGQNRLSFLLFDLFYFINFLAIFFITFQKSKEKILTGFLIVAIAIILPSYFGSANAFLLMAFLLFWIRYSLDNNSFIIYIFQTILILLLFYIKFNTGLISFLFFVLAITYKLIAKKGDYKLLIVYLLTPFILVYFTSNLLNVELSSYIKSALEIVGGFNDIMYLERPFGDRHVFAILIILFSLVVLYFKVFKNTEEKILKRLLILFIFSVSIYVQYKQSFVRADDSHILEFFNYCILLIFCVYDFHIYKSKFFIKGLLVLTVIISFFYVNKLNANPTNFDLKLSKSGYIDGFKSFTKISSVHLFPNNNQLPETIKNKIGSSSIDAYPWNTQLLLENKLNFTPRPVFQSYTAYTPKLEEKNFEHYSSEKGPKYVLYEFGSLDNRYPLFDETKLNLLLTKNYSCIDTLTQNNKLILLLEKTNKKNIKLVQTKEYAMFIDSPLIPKDGIYYKVFLYRNLIGDFVSLLNHAPEMNLSVQMNEGNFINYKTSKGLLETGVFGTQHIASTNDFKDLILQQNLDKRKILAYYFRPKSPSLFKVKIRIKEYRIVVD
jgi:hypothetical protein